MIRSAEILVLSHRLSRTRLFGTGQNLTRDAIVVRLADGDGHVGWGETYLVPGVADAARALAAPLVGRDPDEAPAGLASVGVVNTWALGAVSIALDDLRARRRGIPVSGLYGPRRRDRVRAYASSRGYVAGASPDEAWTEEAAAVWDAGFRAMKIRIGRYPVWSEIAAIERLVEGAPALVWMADGNGAYGLDESRLVGRALETMAFRWLEEPLPTTDYGAYGPLADELAIPLAGGEMLESAVAAEPLLHGGSFDLVQPDVSICGGIGGVLDVAVRAVAADRFAMPHACSGAIALAATLQALAVLPTPDAAPPWAEPLLEHDVGENPIRTAVLTETPEPIDGWMAIPAGPGLGVDVDEDAIRRLVA